MGFLFQYTGYYSSCARRGDWPLGTVGTKLFENFGNWHCILHLLFPAGWTKHITRIAKRGSRQKKQKKKLTFGPHADREALFQSALLALSPHVHVNVAAIAVFALVDCILRYTPAEESYQFGKEKTKRLAIDRPKQINPVTQCIPLHPSQVRAL